MALTEEEIQEIKDYVKAYPNKRGACVEALKIVQRHDGWVSDRHLREVAALLEVTEAEVDQTTTASFEALFLQRVDSS